VEYERFQEPLAVSCLIVDLHANHSGFPMGLLRARCTLFLCLAQVSAACITAATVAALASR
jgi:hypothetical protein